MEKKRYETECCMCKEKIYVCKSFGMEIGVTNIGFGRCPKCDEYIMLIWNGSKRKMSSEKMEEG